MVAIHCGDLMYRSLPGLPRTCYPIVRLRFIELLSSLSCLFRAHQAPLRLTDKLHLGLLQFRKKEGSLWRSFCERILYPPCYSQGHDSLTCSLPFLFQAAAIRPNIGTSATTPLIGLLFVDECGPKAPRADSGPLRDFVRAIFDHVTPSIFPRPRPVDSNCKLSDSMQIRKPRFSLRVSQVRRPFALAQIALTPMDSDRDIFGIKSVEYKDSFLYTLGHPCARMA
jgi:hypothetical protein